MYTRKQNLIGVCKIDYIDKLCMVVTELLDRQMSFEIDINDNDYYNIKCNVNDDELNMIKENIIVKDLLYIQN